MGYGGYSSSNRATRAVSSGFYSKSTAEIFSRNFNSSMNPNGVDIRESRDSDEHPLSIPVIIALDVTGSMGHIPHHLVKDGLPHIVQTVIDEGVAHPQILFMGIGDHTCDRAPLQVGQFESSDELLDRWLTDLYLEGGGGGNDGESYLLAWYFASRFTSTDHWDKRGKKGILFTIGDEPNLDTLPAAVQTAIMGPGQYKDVTKAQLLKEVRERYEIFHIHVLQGHNGRRPEVKDGWEKMLEDHVICVQNQDQIPSVIAANILAVVGEQDLEPDASLERFDNLGD